MRPSEFIGDMDPDIAYRFDLAAFQSAQRSKRSFSGKPRPPFVKFWN